MDQRGIEDLIIELLAEQSHRDPRDLRADLEALGDDLPIDSLMAAEVLAIVEHRLGVSLPATAENAKNLRSVGLFASAILRLLADADQATAQEGA